MATDGTQDVKAQLYLYCVDYIESRIAAIRTTIEDAREAANNETKSSAGDKYETGREVMQQEIDMNLVRLNELNTLKQTLERITSDKKTDRVAPGSVVLTSNGNYYMAISAGAPTINSERYYAISAASPIGKLLSGKMAGETFSFNGKPFTIEHVY